MKNVSLRQLRAFSSAAKYLNFAKAAKELCVTPPAISMNIKELEEEVGFSLFNRSKRQLSLTTVGEYLLADTHKILATLKDAEDTVAKLRGVSIGELTIGMVGTAVYFVPRLLANFRQQYPGIKMELRIGRNRTHLGQMLRNVEVDMVIMGRPPEDFSARSEPFAIHPLVMITHPEHNLLNDGHISRQELAQEKFIIREEGSGTRAALEGFFKQHRLNPPIIMEMASNEAIKHAVMAGMGVSVLSEHTIALERHLGLLSVPDVEGLPIARRWQLVRNHGKQLSPSAEALRYFILEHGQNQIDNLVQNPHLM